MSGVPGINAAHAIITWRCRDVALDDVSAFDEACKRLREKYKKLIELRGPDDRANYHLVLSVEPPSESGKQT